MPHRFKSGLEEQDAKAVFLVFTVSVLCVALIVLRGLITHHVWDLYLVWNLFLAWIPLGLALWLQRQGTSQSTRRFWSWALVWLLFFPNAPYILTDLIHLPSPHRSNWWTELVLLLLFALSGLVAGFLSLRIMQRLVAERHGAFAGWIAALGSSSLAGLGLYIGRIERWNSWDVVANPLALLLDAPSWANLQSLKLIALFTVLVLGTHGLLLALAGGETRTHEAKR